MFLEPCPPSTVVGDLDFLAVNPVESQPGPNALLPAYQRLPILAPAVQQVAKSTPGAAYTNIERPELSINGADLIKTHFINQLLEDQRLIGK